MALESSGRPVEPFLKWVGGKSKLLGQFEPFFPSRFDRYYEPFLGGGAVFFHVHPAQAVLNDANPNLIAAYRHIRDELDELLALLRPLQATYYALSPPGQVEFYYSSRAAYNALPPGSLEKTARLLFLNRTGYNGLYRESVKSGFNVPFGRYDNPPIFHEAKLRAVNGALRGAELLNASFEEAVETARPDDFVYFDPPYVPLSRTASFTSYTKADFGPAHQTALADIARRLHARGVLVMLSNSDTPFIRDLYRDFNLHEVQAARAINSKATRRGKITELVITSY